NIPQPYGRLAAKSSLPTTAARPGNPVCLRRTHQASSQGTLFARCAAVIAVVVPLTAPPSLSDRKFAREHPDQDTSGIVAMRSAGHRCLPGTTCGPASTSVKWVYSPTFFYSGYAEHRRD